MSGMWIGPILQQTRGPACGPCCVGMALKLLKGRELPYGTIFTDGQAQNVSGGWDHNGASTRWMKALLDSYQINATVKSTAPTIKEALRQSTLRTPRIAMVKLGSAVSANLSGYHWVVFVSRQTRFGRASIYTIYDPLFPIDSTNQGSERYTCPKYFSRKNLAKHI
jgi:hypothetical protein